MTHAKLKQIFDVVANRIPNSGFVGDLRALANHVETTPEEFDNAIQHLSFLERLSETVDGADEEMEEIDA